MIPFLPHPCIWGVMHPISLLLPTHRMREHQQQWDRASPVFFDSKNWGFLELLAQFLPLPRDALVKQPNLSYFNSFPHRVMTKERHPQVPRAPGYNAVSDLYPSAPSALYHLSLTPRILNLHCLVTCCDQEKLQKGLCASCRLGTVSPPSAVRTGVGSPSGGVVLSPPQWPADLQKHMASWHRVPTLATRRKPG